MQEKSKPIDNNKQLGAFYTPQLLADWVAEELINLSGTSGYFIDPACGDGMLLRSLSRLAKTIKILGIDIDNTAIKLAENNLPKNARFHKSDFLAPNGLKEKPDQYWKKEFKTEKINGVIANPPWGAELNYTKEELSKLGYSLNNGQYDIYELFVELCLKILPTNSILAFILPDSIFSDGHAKFRKLLLDETQIKLIARLGEGFFTDVYRGTVVLILKKNTENSNNWITSFRLNKKWRKLIFANETELSNAKKELSHKISQKRFLENENYQFDIDATTTDLERISKITDMSMSWTDYFISGRGIEISKHGKVITCPKCNSAYPQPRKRIIIECKYCGFYFRVNNSETMDIIRKFTCEDYFEGWKAFIVGEDINRYEIMPSRQIKLDVNGINYKDPTIFMKDKLLIRKTGVGISASIDKSKSFTNQVVFHYVTKKNTPQFYLDYVLGVLNSRIMLVYHLKNHGEVEWRSHPYITQSIISDLPIPHINPGTWKWNQAKTIARNVKRMLKSRNHDIKSDIKIESLVAGLYGFSKNDIEWVLNVISSAEPLKPIRKMIFSDYYSEINPEFVK